MKLTLEGIEDRKVWEEAGVSLPSHDVETVAEATREEPVWVHFGIGDIFHIFIDGIADMLILEGMGGKGITCAEAFDFNVIKKIYKPCDNLASGVALKAGGPTNKKIVGSFTEALKAQTGGVRDWKRLKDIFTDPGLQTTSFIITKKGYVLEGTDGACFLFIQTDIDSGSGNVIPTMAVMCNLLYERYKAGRAFLAVVFMDNCSHNGERLQESVIAMTKGRGRRKCVGDGSIAYLSSRGQVSFPWSIIDKVMPYLAGSVQTKLKNARMKDMTLVITSRSIYIAPLVNAEGPQYLAIEDCFLNGRPVLEKTGVYMVDQDTVNEMEQVKVTTCLNPLHTALAVYGCVLEYALIIGEIKDPPLNKLIRLIGSGEGIPVIAGPGILSPKNFMNKVIDMGISSPFMSDTPQRIVTDISQKVGVRYGETVKTYISKYEDAGKLTAIPPAIAGQYKYLLAMDDEGKKSEPSADPVVSGLTKTLKGIVVDRPEAYKGQLKNILSNVNISGVDPYEAGIGETIEGMFREETAGPGAVRAVLKKYLNA